MLTGEMYNEMLQHLSTTWGMWLLIITVSLDQESSVIVKLFTGRVGKFQEPISKI